MAEVNGEGRPVVRLGESGLVLEEPWHDDVRGREVRTADGQKMGTVEEVYVDEEEREVRSLVVESGSGLLGTSIGETRRMMPVEAVTDAGADGITVDSDHDVAAGSPETLDPNVVHDPDRRRDV